MIYPAISQSYITKKTYFKKSHFNYKMEKGNRELEF